MFSDEYSVNHNKEIKFPKQGDVVTHKVYGRVRVWDVFEDELEAEVFQIGGDKMETFIVSLEDIR